MPNSSQSEDLCKISEAKGWDPSKIWDQEQGKYVTDISEWDHPREPFARGLGELKGELPAVSGPIPKRPPNEPGSSGDPSEGSPYSERVTWNHPSMSDNHANLRPNLAEGFKQYMSSNVPWNSPKRRGER